MLGNRWIVRRRIEPYLQVWRACRKGRKPPCGCRRKRVSLWEKVYDLLTVSTLDLADWPIAMERETMTRLFRQPRPKTNKPDSKSAPSAPRVREPNVELFDEGETLADYCRNAGVSSEDVNLTFSGRAC